MDRSANIVACARKWVGTPFHHQARSRGVGVDCIGLLIGVAHDAGLGDYEFRGYDRVPNPKVLLKEVAANLKRVYTLTPGCVLLFRIISDPQHFGIYLGGEEFIHAYNIRGKVMLDVLDTPWKRRVVGMYEFKERYA